MNPLERITQAVLATVVDRQAEPATELEERVVGARPHGGRLVVPVAGPRDANGRSSEANKINRTKKRDRKRQVAAAARVRARDVWLEQARVNPAVHEWIVQNHPEYLEVARRGVTGIVAVSRPPMVFLPNAVPPQSSSSSSSDSANGGGAPALDASHGRPMEDDELSVGSWSVMLDDYDANEYDYGANDIEFGSGGDDWLDASNAIGDASPVVVAASAPTPYVAGLPPLPTLPSAGVVIHGERGSQSMQLERIDPVAAAPAALLMVSSSQSPTPSVAPTPSTPSGKFGAGNGDFSPHYPSPLLQSQSSRVMTPVYIPRQLVVNVPQSPRSSGEVTPRSEPSSPAHSASSSRSHGRSARRAVSNRDARSAASSVSVASRLPRIVEASSDGSDSDTSSRRSARRGHAASVGGAVAPRASSRAGSARGSRASSPVPIDVPAPGTLTIDALLRDTAYDNLGYTDKARVCIQFRQTLSPELQAEILAKRAFAPGNGRVPIQNCTSSSNFRNIMHVRMGGAILKVIYPTRQVVVWDPTSEKFEVSRPAQRLTPPRPGDRAMFLIPDDRELAVPPHIAYPDNDDDDNSSVLVTDFVDGRNDDESDSDDDE